MELNVKMEICEGIIWLCPWRLRWWRASVGHCPVAVSLGALSHLHLCCAATHADLLCGQEEGCEPESIYQMEDLDEPGAQRACERSQQGESALETAAPRACWPPPLGVLGHRLPFATYLRGRLGACL